MMGDQNDKQRRCFWWFMVGFRRRGMTPMTSVGSSVTYSSGGALDRLSRVSSARDRGAVSDQSPSSIGAGNFTVPHSPRLR